MITNNKVKPPHNTKNGITKLLNIILIVFPPLFYIYIIS